MVAEQNQPSLRKWFAAGGLMAVIGSGLFVSLDPLLNMALKSQVNLDPEGPIFANWKTAPIPAYYKFYIMNVDNPRETVRGEKLRVSEKGPYTFQQWRRKEIIQWAPDKSTVTYYDYKKYILDEELTNGDLDDVITTINPLVATFGATITKLLKEDLPIPLVLSPFIYGSINGLFAVHRQGLFVTQTVRELLFGRRINLLDTITTLMKPLDLFGIKLDMFPKEALPPNNTVGLLFGKNNTAEGPYEVYTGLAGEGKAFDFVSWQGKKKLKWWKSRECNMINGTEGALFGTGIKPTDKLYAFGADLCRSLSLKFLEKSEYKGIPTYKFGIPDDFFSSIDEYPWNECFCMHKDKNKCRVGGLYDLGGCQYGAPLVVSTPHFLNFPHLQNLVDGLTPDQEKHGTYLHVQPGVGAAIFGIKRLMFAVRVESNPRIGAFGKARDMFVPFVWVEESGGLNDELAADMRNSLVYPVRGASIATAGIGVGGAALVVAALVKQRRRRNAKSGADYGPKINENGSEKRAPKPQTNGETRIAVDDKIKEGNEALNASFPQSETFENVLNGKLSNGNVRQNYSGHVLGTAQSVNNNSHAHEMHAENGFENETLLQSDHSHSSDAESANNLPPLENTNNAPENDEFIANTSPDKHFRRVF